MVRLGLSFVFAFGFYAAYLSVTLAVFSTNNLKSSSMAGPPIYKTNTLSQIAINNILTCVLLLLLLLLLLVLPLGVDAMMCLNFQFTLGAFLAQLLRNHKMFDFRLSVGNWHYDDDDQVIFGGNFIGPSNA